MPTLPDLTIVATTWAPEGIIGVSRLNSWEHSLESWGQHLVYEGRLFLHVADDGSREVDGLPAPIRAAVQHWNGEPISGSVQARRGVGASLNAGFKRAFERSPLAAYFVDDWKLVEDIDLTPWAELLMEDESVGMVRLGPPHPAIWGQIEMFRTGWALRLNALPGGYVFGHRPALYHQRFIDAYGPFNEGISAMECERLYNERFIEKVNDPHRPASPKLPDVVYALPYPWRHIGDQEVGDITPS